MGIFSIFFIFGDKEFLEVDENTLGFLMAV